MHNVSKSYGMEIWNSKQYINTNNGSILGKICGKLCRFFVSSMDQNDEYRTNENVQA